MLAEFDTIVVHVEPPSVDRSILYPVMGEPPLFGVVQLRLICEGEAAVATSPAGGDGATAGVVAEGAFDGELVPTEFIAETL